MANLYQNRFRIESARATWHDYNGGIYFINTTKIFVFQ